MFGLDNDRIYLDIHNSIFQFDFEVFSYAFNKMPNHKKNV